MLKEPPIKARYEVLGIEATSATPEQLTATMRREIELWGPIVKAANIRGE
jgi:tripartite-type tricarboxylate transporter receptor subunit TctC